MGTKEYKKPEWVTQMEETKAKQQGSLEEMLYDSLDCINVRSTLDFSSEPPAHNNALFDFITNDTVEPEQNRIYKYHSSDFGSYRINSSFHLLPPIEESSEPSSTGSSNTHIESYVRSSSCHDIPDTPSFNDFPSTDYSQRCHTYPKRSKNVRINYELTENRTLYPLEPREIDPGAFFQLHTVDSQEELQEFLLLESQCMSNDGGISAAFCDDDAGKSCCSLVTQMMEKFKYQIPTISSFSGKYDGFEITFNFSITMLRFPNKFTF